MTTEIEDANDLSINQLPSGNQIRLVFIDHEVKDFDDISYQKMVSICEKILFETKYRLENGGTASVFIAQFPEGWQPPIAIKEEEKGG